MFTGAKIGAFNLLRYPFVISSRLDEVTTYANNITSNGGTISSNSLQALSTFVDTLKLNSLYDKALEIAPYAGDNLNAALVKLKYPSGVQSVLTNVGFVSGDYTEATGLTGDTSGTKYLRTGYTPSINLVNSLDAHLSVYARNLTALGGLDSNPAYLGSSTGHNFRIERSSGNIRALLGTGAEMVATYNVTASPGHLIGSTIAANQGYLFYNGNQVGVDTSFTTNGLSTSEIYIIGNNSNNILNRSSNLICAFHSIGYGLTPSEASIFYNAVQALQTSLGRNV